MLRKSLALLLLASGDRLGALADADATANPTGDSMEDATENPEEQFAAHPQAPAKTTVFFENFDAGADSAQLSSGEQYQGQNVQVRTVQGSAFENDNALVLEDDAHHYGIVMPVNANAAASVDPESDDFVLQYEVRLTRGLECGGAYLKLLDANNLPANGNVEPDSPYIIMFGPNKCGNDNKIHFILRHQNPINNEWEEKHINSDIPIQGDNLSHLYTLVIRQDNTFDIMVDGKAAKSGNLLESMKPPINPPKEIDDPEDKKPSDWVDDAKIPDPEASKPDDWDEDAPKTILDEEASMPDGWLEDETYLIPDPAAAMPEEWDQEDDGEWEAPTIQNPKCASAPGCEKWVRPTIPNPQYKGKWFPPMIDNPDYSGEWSPSRIDNPYYFVDSTPAKGLMDSVGAVAVEVWIYKNGGIAFDNVLLSTSEDDALALAGKSFKVKATLEKVKGDDLERQRRHKANLKLLEQGGIVGTIQYYMYETLDLARAWPIAFGGGALALVAFLIYLCCATCCKAEDDFADEDGDGDAAAAAAAAASGTSGADADQGTTEGEEEEDAQIAQPTEGGEGAQNEGGEGEDEDEDDDDDAPVLAQKSEQAKKDD